jgi:hypothetical protein
MTEQRRLAAIVSADVAGYSRLTCLFLAQMRSADRVRRCRLFGVDRTYRRHRETDAFDPKRTPAERELWNPVERLGSNG